MQGGMLILRSRQVGRTNWTTGAAITHNRDHANRNTTAGMAWRYGRFCVRAKLPGAGPGKSQGLWPVPLSEAHFTCVCPIVFYVTKTAHVPAEITYQW